MTRKDRILYGQKNARLLKKFERTYTKQIYTAIQAQTKAAADMLREKGIDFLKHHIDTVVTIDSLVPVMRTIYQVVGLYYANRTMREINKSAKAAEKKGFGFDLKWIKDILNFFRLYLLTKAVLPITETTKARIMEVLTEGEQSGWGIDKMAFKIENDSMTVARARLIARTETLKAQFNGQNLAMSDSIWESDKLWIATDDGRTRHSHLDVDGEVKSEQARFAVPIYTSKGIRIGVDLMEGPGDPDASAANVCNCRCTLSVTARRDPNGRLIRKPTGRLVLRNVLVEH